MLYYDCIPLPQKILLLDSLFLEQYERSGYDVVKRALNIVSIPGLVCMGFGCYPILYIGSAHFIKSHVHPREHRPDTLEPYCEFALCM